MRRFWCVVVVNGDGDLRFVAGPFTRKVLAERWTRAEVEDVTYTVMELHGGDL